MSRILLATLLLVSTTSFAGSETASSTSGSRLKHWSAGLNFDSMGKDFGLGVQVNSPYYWGHWSVRIAATEGILQGFPQGATEEEGRFYTSLKLGIFGATEVMSNLMRLYGGGGLVTSIPSSAISSQVQFGGFGGFGFEFLLHPEGCSTFFLEAGGTAGGRADNYIGKPNFGTGFWASTGTRFYF
jgi:hypothetical protein